MSNNKQNENAIAKVGNKNQITLAKNLEGKCTSTGSSNHEFTTVLINQVVSTLWNAHSNEEEKSYQLSATLASLTGIQPKDEIEGMLAVQMIGLHNAAIECFRRSMIKEQSLEGRDCNLKHASKLTRSYAALVEALQKYRGKGVSEQKVTVQHVHVSEGGQAIVGTVANG